MTDLNATRNEARLNAQAVAEATETAVQAVLRAAATERVDVANAANFAESDAVNALNAALDRCSDREFRDAFVAAFVENFVTARD